MNNIQNIIDKQEVYKRKILRNLLDYVLQDNSSILDITNYIYSNELLFLSILEKDTFNILTNVKNNKWCITNIITEIILTSLDQLGE